MPDIRLSTLTRLANTAGVTIIGYIMPGGRPVGLDPATLYPTPQQIGAASELDLTNGLGTKQSVSQRGLANGYASLDAAGRVPAAQIPAGVGGGAAVSDAVPAPLGSAAPGALSTASRADHIHPLPTPADIGAAPVTHTHGITAISGLQLSLDGKLNANALGAANGAASLGSDGKVLPGQLPPGLSQAALDAKADAAATTTALNSKAGIAYVDTQLALKLNANDTRVANAIQPNHLATVEIFATNYTATTGDINKIKRCSSASNVNITLPAMAVGTTIRFTQGNTGTLTFIAGASQTIESVGNAITTVGRGANVIATVQATNLWNIDGGIA